jgi:hypothetical protein
MSLNLGNPGRVNKWQEEKDQKILMPAEKLKYSKGRPGLPFMVRMPVRAVFPKNLFIDLCKYVQFKNLDYF